ncbi:MAG: hypothetical protein M3179_07770 [Actinomycetota bacterium]|nr:hypothetical protein [Actinomycetota bacterium]
MDTEMTAVDMAAPHLDETRAEVAREARDAVLEAAQIWAVAPKVQVGAVALPGDPAAARAFNAFHGARGEFASHVGGEAAAREAQRALATAASDGTAGPSG